MVKTENTICKIAFQLIGNSKIPCGLIMLYLLYVTSGVLIWSKMFS